MWEQKKYPKFPLDFRSPGWYNGGMSLLMKKSNRVHLGLHKTQEKAQKALDKHKELNPELGARYFWIKKDRKKYGQRSYFAYALVPKN